MLLPEFLSVKNSEEIIMPNSLLYPTEKAEFGFWGNRHFLSTNRPTLK